MMERGRGERGVEQREERCGIHEVTGSGEGIVGNRTGRTKNLWERGSEEEEDGRQRAITTDEERYTELCLILRYIAVRCLWTLYHLHQQRMNGSQTSQSQKV